ncbi:class I SAM-dependent methyltransferase [Nocardia takedensis]
MSPTDDTITASYDRHAAVFAAEAADSAYNAHYDRPTVLDLLGDLTDRTVLDAGCGPGLYITELLARGAHVIAIDAAANMIDLARRHAGGQITLRRHDLTQPLHWLPTNSIDTALLALVIHYIDDRTALLRELHRVLRPGGHLIISTSHPTADWLTTGGSYFDTGWTEQQWSCGITHRYWHHRAPTRGERMPAACRIRNTSTISRESQPSRPERVATDPSTVRQPVRPSTREL